MEVDTIRITHYINPHMFWYKPVSAYVHNLEEKRFQLAIDEYCEEHFRQSTAERHYDAFPGETVAVLDFERNKWCRCVVDDVVEDNSGEKQYNLWAIDDGVPLQSSSRYVNPLPKKFSSEDTSKVKRGAIKNILPSECIYDYNADRIVPKIMLRWDAGASSVLQTIIKNSTIVYFRNVTKHKVHNIPINMGELELLTRKNNIFRAGEVLKEMRRATEVEPRDFITRLLEIQTMSVDRFRGGESSDSTKRNQEKPQIISPNKSFSRYDRNGYMRMPNGVADDSGVRELELNGVKEEDFDESASMVKPNHAPERARPYQPFVGTIEEIPQSEEEVYPISSSRVKAGVNADFERQLWKQTIRPPCIDTFAQLKITDPDEVVERNVPKNISNRNYPPMANTRYEENDDSNTLEKPKTTVSFLSKLEMRKKMRAAQKTASSGTVEQKPSSALINIVPAGFDMGNVSFDNGKIVAGDSSDSSERKAKHTSPSFKPRTSFEQQVRQRLTPPTNGERSTAVVDKQHHDADSGVQNSKVYMSKHTSRFDQLIEDEACVRSRLCHQRLLVHGKRIPKPVEKLENANFCPEVHRELSMLSFGSIHRIQTYGWPHILRGNSFFCVNSPATGKTFAYLPAICSVILEMHDEGLTPEGAGPLAIIICKSSREVQRVASYCKKMLNFSVNRTMVVVEAFGARDIPKVCNLLLNGCAILAATAPAYRRVYENMPNAFVKKRIQTIVIDNIDAIIERFGSELQLLCKNCDKPELQMVVTATYWNPIFFGFLKKYKNMVICIGAYLEAAIYGKSNLVLKLKSHAAKLSEILSFIKENNYQSERILIVCSAASEVYEVVEQLKSQSITHMHCNDLTTLTKMDGFKEWDNQQPGEMHVLVCYDAVVPDLEVNKAQHIIHYSLSKSWTMFTRRFACSFGYYKDPFREESNKPRQSSSSLILLDENNNEQLPKLVEYLRIHNHEVAEPIVKLANNIRIQQEENKLATGNPVDFCSQVLDFGKCRSTGCMKRHVFTTRDLATGDLPTSGIVKVKINNMFSPTHYAVRILEHREYGASDWTTINDAQDFFTLDLEMQQYYANEERHQSHGNVRYNDWCVIYDEYRYWRCRIISIDQRKETTTTSRKVKVKLLDVGRTIDCVSSELLYLTEEFSRLPAQAVDVRIIGVVPHDFETEWDKRVTVTIREWINKYTADDKFHVEGKILLAVRDTIWVDTIRLVEHLGGINAEVHEIHVKSEIVGKVFGVTDKEPLELLKRMVESCEAFKKRANVVEDECVSVEGNETSSESSKSNEFFRNGTKCREVDKPNKTLSSQNSIENSDTESDKYNQTLQSLKSIKCSDTESDKPNNTVSSLKPIECSDTETFKPNKSVSFHKPIEYSDTESDKPDETLQSLKLIKCSDTKLNKPNKTVLSRKPIECSDTESDGCTPHPLNNKKYVPEKVTNIAEEGKQPDVTSESQRKPRLIFEEYDELEDELVHEVYISQYYAPDDFYVCRVEKFSVMTQLIRNFTENTTNLIPLEQAQVGDFCLVFYDNAYQRAKVTRIEGRDIRVFFLDLGGYDTYVSVDLFELPDELLKASAFCAIKAKMACLKPRENEDQGWSPEVGDRIYDEVLACYGTFNSKVIETIRNYATDAIVNCKCYRLLLFDPENMLESWIFDEIVELKLARYIEDERPYAVDVNFGDEEFMKLFDPRYNEEAKPKDDDDFGAKIEEIVDTSTTTSQIETTPKPKARSRLALLKQRLRKKNTVKAITYPKLKCDFRSPKTVWRQDDSLIVIRVSVPENVRYDLKVDYDSLKLCFVHDDDKYLLSIIFFASIVPELTVHEVRGLSILMRLVKFVQTIQWPSLMRHGDRVPWLQQCIEVPNSDETDAYDGMHRTLPTVPNLNVSSDSLSDETEYSDQFDPIEDDYFLKD